MLSCFPRVAIISLILTIVVVADGIPATTCVGVADLLRKAAEDAASKPGTPPAEGNPFDVIVGAVADNSDSSKTLWKKLLDCVGESPKWPDGIQPYAEAVRAELLNGKLGQAASNTNPALVIDWMPSGWRYLGPFPCGKTELDGDPLAYPSSGSVGSEHPMIAATRAWRRRELLVAACNALRGAISGQQDVALKEQDCTSLGSALMKASSWTSAGSNPQTSAGSVLRSRGPFEYHTELLPGGRVPPKDVWRALRGSGPSGNKKARVQSFSTKSNNGVWEASAPTRRSQLQVQHNDLGALVQPIGTMAVLEFIGFAFTDAAITASIPAENIAGGSLQVKVTAAGVHSMFFSVVSASAGVDIDRNVMHGVSGDQYGKKYPATTASVPFSLTGPTTKSITIVVRFFSKLRGRAQASQDLSVSLGVSFKGPAFDVSKLVPALSVASPIAVPDIVDGTFFGSLQRRISGSWLAVPVTIAAPGQGPRPTVTGWTGSLEGRLAQNFCVGAKECGISAAPDECGNDSDACGEEEGSSSADDWEYAKYLRHLNSLEMSHANGEVPIAAGQIAPVPVFIGIRRSSHRAALRAHCIRHGGISLTLKLSGTSGSNVVQGSTKVELRCRDIAKESFVFTFLDRDGSVSLGAARTPLDTDAATTAASPVILSLHGTGVSGNSQVDSYKRAPGKGEAHLAKGDYVFGIKGAWIVAPDRFGAHNWETIGKFSALAALFHVHRTSAAWNTILASESDGLKFPIADKNRVVYAGHSMGGHGALHIAAHDPDRCIGVILLAAWITKEHYGDANEIFALDTSTAYVDGAARGTLESTVSDNNPDLLLSNLMHVPVAIRVGSRDQTVSPYYGRRLWRLLRQQGHPDVTYDEVEGKEHWWWDTSKPNDGGCMSDPPLRKAFKRMLRDGSAKDVNPMTDSAFVAGTILTTLNPHAAHSLNGLRVVEQQRQLRPSTLTLASIDSNDGGLKVVIQAENVAKFQLFGIASAMKTVELTVLSITMDGEVVESKSIIQLGSGSTTKTVEVHLLGGRITQAGSDVKTAEASNLPPSLRHYAEVPSVICAVNPETNLAATFVANLNFIAYDSLVSLCHSEECCERESARRVAVRLSIEKDLICPRNSQNCATVSVVPAKNNARRPFARSFAIDMVAKSAAALEFLVYDIGLPTVPPMMRAPFGNMLPANFTAIVERRHEGYGAIFQKA